MKRIITILAAGLFGTSAFAATHTVHNQLASGAQFSTIQAAIDAAADGDTVYIQGSPNVYGSFTLIDKKLILLGPGWAPDKNNPIRAIIAGGQVRNSSAATTGANASGSEFNGLVFNNMLSLSAFNGGDKSVNNIRIVRCEFRSGVDVSLSANNYIVEGCYIAGSLARFSFNSGNSYSNMLFHNNIFLIQTFNNGCFTGLNNTGGILIDHNLFYTDAPGATGSPIFTANSNRFLTITNNIFVNMDAGSGISSSTYNNNITFYSAASITTPPAAPWTINSNINGGGNVNATNPQMVSQASVNAGTDNPTLDFSIAAGPANNTGSDGKDMGLRFDATGSLNWNSSRASRLPFIFSMNITNPTVAPGGNLNVEVTAKKNN